MAKCIVYKELNYLIKFIGFLSTEVCLLIVNLIFEGLNVWTLSLSCTRSFLFQNWRNLETREISKFVFQAFVKILIWDILISCFRDVFESSKLILLLTRRRCVKNSVKSNVSCFKASFGETITCVGKSWRSRPRAKVNPPLDFFQNSLNGFQLFEFYIWNTYL